MVGVSVNVTSVLSCALLNSGWVLASFPSLAPEKCRWMTRACWEGKALSGFVVSSLVSPGTRTYRLWICCSGKPVSLCPKQGQQKEMKEFSSEFSWCIPRSPVMTVLSALNQDDVKELQGMSPLKLFLLCVHNCLFLPESLNNCCWMSEVHRCLHPLCIGMKVACRIK